MKKNSENSKLSPAEVWKNASKLMKPKKPIHKKTIERKNDDYSFLKSLLSYPTNKIHSLGSEDLYLQYKKDQISNMFRFYDLKYKDYFPNELADNFKEYFPSTPLQIFDMEEVYSKLDLDTLFYIFYTQNNTVYQYFAIKTLRDRSWRFHTKYTTWFQRLEEPKYITEEYEQGSFLFFDFDTTWQIRKKSDFTFEYKYLEPTEF